MRTWSALYGSVVLLLLAGCTPGQKTGAVPKRGFITTDKFELSRAAQCGQCHETAYSEWSFSRLSRSGNNPNFLAFYELAQKDLGAEAAADACLNCHVPWSERYEEASGGVDCDVCHRVKGVKKHPDGRYSFIQSKGVAISGPPTDGTCRHQNVESELYHDSKICAPCHTAVHRPEGLASVSTFEKWEEAYQGDDTCQNCHMQSTNKLVAASHGFPGGHNQVFLEEAVRTQLRSSEDKGLRAWLINAVAGHNFPGEAHDVRSVVMTARWLDAGREILKQEEVFRLGSAFSDASGRPVPFWRAKSARKNYIEPSDFAEIPLSPPQGAQFVELETIYHHIAPELAWLFVGLPYEVPKGTLAGRQLYDLSTNRPID